MGKKTPHVRPDWDEYFINIALVVGERGTCDRGRSGAVLTKDNRIIMTGYVGSPPRLPHCDEAGHEMQERRHADGTVSKHCVRTLHAEENAMLHAAKFGVKIQGATMYSKMTPCINCARQMVACGIKRLVNLNDYHASAKSKALFKQAGIEHIIISDKEEEYTDK